MMNLSFAEESARLNSILTVIDYFKRVKVGRRLSSGNVPSSSSSLNDREFELQRLKPRADRRHCGTAEAVPSQELDLAQIPFARPCTSDEG
jgi:hypothetical protein